jgi:hypothetical protein
MFDPLIKFQENVTVAGQRETLIKRISILELDRADHQNEIDRLEKIVRQWQGKLSRAQERGHSMDTDIAKGTEQLLSLLPGVVSNVPFRGLYHFQGEELLGSVQLHRRKQPDPDYPGQPQEMREDIEVEKR